MIEYFPHLVRVSFQEFPGHINLIVPIAKCGKCCFGCHSPELQGNENAIFLTQEIFENLLKKYEGFIDTVIFFGGDRSPEDLLTFIFLAKKRNLITVLYTGFDISEIDSKLLAELDYIKYGEYKKELGSLDSEKTNQVFLNLKTNERLNNLFLKTNK